VRPRRPLATGAECHDWRRGGEAEQLLPNVTPEAPRPSPMAAFAGFLIFTCMTAGMSVLVSFARSQNCATDHYRTTYDCGALSTRMDAVFLGALALAAVSTLLYVGTLAREANGRSRQGERRPRQWIAAVSLALWCGIAIAALIS